MIDFDSEWRAVAHRFSATTSQSADRHAAQPETLALIHLAHEVRNPPGALLSLVELAIHDLPPSSIAHSGLQRAAALIEHIECMLRQALNYGRPHLPQRQPHRLAFLAENALEMLRPHGSKVMACALPDDLPAVYVDGGQIERALVSLLENARDAAQRHVQIRARRGAAGPSVLVEISDDGPGVPVELTDRIFDPFFTTKPHGTGLGLAIARDLARINGGDLTIFKTSPEGSVFHLLLPTSPQGVRQEDQEVP